MPDSVYVILHGAFAFFEYDDKILVRLAAIDEHRYQVWIPFGPPIDIKGSPRRLVLTGVAGGSESLVDQSRDEMVYLKDAGPSSAVRAAAEVVLPRPISVTTLMGEELKTPPIVTGPKAAHTPPNFAVKWLLRYEANGQPELGGFPLKDTVTIIAGPSGTASPGHGTHAFAETIKQFDGYSGVWSMSPAGAPRILSDPPGCSPSGGSKNSGNCGC